MTTCCEQVARERDDVARALEDVLLEGLQRGLALLLDVDLDPVVVRATSGGSRGRGWPGVTRCGTSFWKWLTWVRDRFGQQHADADDHRDPAQIHGADRQPARDLDPLEHPHQRVEDQRHHATRPSGSAAPSRRPAPAPTVPAAPAGAARAGSIAGHHRRDRRSGGLLGDSSGSSPPGRSPSRRPRRRVGLPPTANSLASGSGGPSSDCPFVARRPCAIRGIRLATRSAWEA